MFPQSKKEGYPASYDQQKSPALWRAIIILFKSLISPLVLLIDLFRDKKVKMRWVMYNFTICCLALVITGLCIVFAERPTREVLSLLADFNSGRRKLGENLTIDKDIVNAINYYALKNNIDPFLIHAMIKMESNYKPYEVSHRGAKGIMQLMPGIWTMYWAKYGEHNACDGEHSPAQTCLFEHCIFKPKDNIRVGINYLADLIKVCNGHVEMALQAYNAGLSNVSDEEPLFSETRRYNRDIAAFASEQRMKAFLGLELETAWRLKQSEPWMLGITGALWLIFGLWMWRKGFES